MQKAERKNNFYFSADGLLPSPSLQSSVFLLIHFTLSDLRFQIAGFVL